MKTLLAILTLLLLAACVRGEEAPAMHQAETEAAEDIVERVEAIRADELTWRFPNSMAQTMSDDGNAMRLDLVRARVLLGTQDLARTLGEQQRTQLLKSLREMHPDEECRALAHVRLLAAAGVPEAQISAACPDLSLWESWSQVIREGLALREVG